MKNLVISISCMCLISCSSQENKSIDFKNTSWGTIYEEDILGDYLEMYFTDENVYYYGGALGITKLEYRIINGVFSTRFGPDSKFIERSEISIIDDTLYLNEIGGKRNVKNIRIKENTIKDLIEGNIQESSFREYFDERLLKAIGKE